MDKHTKIPPAVIATGTKKHITSMQKFFILDDEGGIKVFHARFIVLYVIEVNQHGQKSRNEEKQREYEAIKKSNKREKIDKIANQGQ